MDTTRRKPWSELALLICAAIAVLVAAAVSGALQSPQAWTLLALLAGAYALSRGFGRSTWPHGEPLRSTDHTSTPARPASGTEAEVTVSEERLEVDKLRRPRERVVLRKDVVTEEVTITVPVRREVVRLERVPIREGEAIEGLTDLGGGRTQELILMEETAVVDKRIVPRERVWLEKDVETREERVTETVRHEEVDVDHLPADDQAEEHR
jgi:uncharacterized protein (TIGR02271 family)